MKHAARQAPPAWALLMVMVAAATITANAAIAAPPPAPAATAAPATSTQGQEPKPQKAKPKPSSKSAGSAAQQAQKIFRAEMAACASGQSVQSRPVCEQEAKAAYAQNLRTGLAGPGSLVDQNARRRCEPLPDAERQGCLARVEGRAAPDAVLVVPGSEAPLQTTTPPRP